MVRIAKAISAAKGTPQEHMPIAAEVHRIAEIELTDGKDKSELGVMNDESQNRLKQNETAPDRNNEVNDEKNTEQTWYWWLAVILVLFIAAGFYRGVVQSKRLTYLHQRASK